MVDASFHTAEWHAARIAALTVVRPPWEEWNQKRKEADLKAAAIAEEEEKLSREYRMQLDADRARLLSKGRNHVELAEALKKTKKRKSKSKKSKKEGKDKDKKKSKKSKKSKKRRRTDGSSSSSSSDSSSGSSSSSDEDGEGDTKPMRLSDWLKS